jgi:hypothetical protein
MPFLPELLLAMIVSAPDPTPIVTPAASPAPAATDPYDWSRRVDRALEAQPRPTPRSEPAKQSVSRFEDGTLYQEIVVGDWYNEYLVLPSYEMAGKPIRGFGVPRGGDGGSPGFDPILRKYWWE